MNPSKEVNSGITSTYAMITIRIELHLKLLIGLN